MSKESYMRGFCKVAEAAGVDPKELAKFAFKIPSAEEIKKGFPPPRLSGDELARLKAMYNTRLSTPQPSPWSITKANLIRRGRKPLQSPMDGSQRGRQSGSLQTREAPAHEMSHATNVPTVTAR